MEFANLTFLYLFLPAAVLVYYLLPGIGRKNTALLVFSLLFYASGWDSARSRGRRAFLLERWC